MPTTTMNGPSTQQRDAADHDSRACSLEHVLAALELRDLDVDEREALDGAEVDARAGDIGQARGENEVGRRALERPAQVADERCRRPGAGQRRSRCPTLRSDAAWVIVSRSATTGTSWSPTTRLPAPGSSSAAPTTLYAAPDFCWICCTTYSTSSASADDEGAGEVVVEPALPEQPLAPDPAAAEQRS